ncbi:hypothetical protein ACFVHQ_03270 [Actinomycetes bacterium NPDC127524]
MKRQLKTAAFILMASLFSVLYLFHSQQAKETILFFPIDPSLSFDYAGTHLLSEKAGKSSFSVRLKSASQLNHPAYIRQDVSLLYRNGRLQGVLKEWRQNKKTLEQEGTWKEKDSSLLQAITFHYAEVHKGPDYRSAQEMSHSSLYIILPPEAGYQYFEKPLSSKQIRWKEILDKAAVLEAEKNLNQNLKAFHINENLYTTLSLTDLPQQKNVFFSAFPSSKREEIIGKLWEGIYKNIALGIKKENGTVISPEGSTIPQLLLSKNKSELLVLLTASDGTPVLLRQELSSR